MSGHKRAFVRLSRAEYERLRDAAADNRLSSASALEPTPTQAAAVMAQSSSAIWEDLETVQARQNALEDLLGRFDHQVRSLEHTTGQALVAQQSAMAEEMQSASGQLYQAADDLIQHNLRSFREQVSRVAREARAGYSAAQEQWQEYAHDQNQRRDVAERWLRSAQEVAGFIQQHYPHEQLAPGQLARAQEGAWLAEQNLQEGLSEAALSAAQQSYLRLSDLRLELERLESQRRILARGLEEKLHELSARAQSARCIAAVDLDGNELGIPLEVDFWTAGSLSQVQGDLRALLGMLATPLDLEALAAIGEALPGIETRLGELAEAARLAVINSQLRFDIAEVVVAALSEQGFTLEEGAFSAGDAREGYCVKLLGADGGEVEVHIAPRPGGEMENDLHLLSHDAEARTRHELRARMNELVRSLSWHGLEVSNTQQLEQGKKPAQPKNKREYARQRVER